MPARSSAVCKPTAVTVITAPRHEGKVRVRDGRELGLAEFGTPDGRPVVWFHGTPGGRRQIPEEARLIAEAEGYRIVCIDRPGVGLSTPHLYDRVVDLVEEGYDLAIRITNLPNSQLVSRQLATTRMIACASPQYLAQHGTPAHPDELAQHEVISYSYFAARDEWTFTAPHETPVVVHTHARIHANNGDTCRAAALEHQGIILQPDFTVADDLRRGDLVKLLPTWRTMTLGIHAVYPSRKHLPIKTRRLVDFLVEGFAVPRWDVGR